MTDVSLRAEAFLVLMGAPRESIEVALRHPGRPGVPPLEVLRRLSRNVREATMASDRSRFSFSVDDADLDDLVLLLPATLAELGEDPAECCARMDAWPEDLEAAQTELLRALGRDPAG